MDNSVFGSNEMHSLLDNLNNVDLRGFMEPVRDVEFRLTLVRNLHGQYERHRNPRDLYAAIENAEALVRSPLPISLADKIEVLNSLSWMKMSVFLLGNSAAMLDEAIGYARMAMRELEADPGNIPQLRMVYDNLGQALCAKSQLAGDPRILDEAIECGRQVVDYSLGEEERVGSTVNVAVRLHLRYRKTGREEDATEALGLLAESLKTLPPGQPGYGAALGAQGEILSQMFKHTGDIEILEQAISSCEKGLLSLPATNERRVDMIRMLSGLYESQYEETRDVTAMRNAVRCFDMILSGFPNHSLKVDFISHQLYLLAALSKAEQSLLGVDVALRKAQLLLASVPVTHTKRDPSAHNVIRILARKYAVTRALSDFRVLVTAVQEMGRVKNEQEERKRTGWRLDLAPVQSLAACVDKLAKRHDGATFSVSEKVFGYFQAANEASGPLNGVLNMYRTHGSDLERLCIETVTTTIAVRETTQQQRGTLEEQLTLPTEQSSVSKTEPGLPTNETSVSRMSSAVRSQKPYHDPFTGMRYLAPSHQGEIILQIEPMVRSIMGYKYDEPEPRTMEEFAAREARLENEALQKEREQGKFPNTYLCRVCRHLEPLQRQPDGSISWNPKLVFPYGTWAQLRCRTHCIICKLILSLLVDKHNKKGEPSLHPRLARIDREIQGTQFNLQTLETGEVMLGVEYGLTGVGALRMVTNKTRSIALRSKTQFYTTDIDYSTVSKVQQWLSNCEEQHPHTCNSVPSEERCTNPIPLLLIDVINQCLVQATSTEKYFALSYVWGGPQALATVKSNVERRYKHGSLARNACDLPKTIRDAMLLVQNLNERYLWVDSLCIIQDDLEHKHRDINQMDIVYMMAFATIAAAHGTNADAGLPGLRPDSRPPQPIENLPILPTTQGEPITWVTLTTTPPLLPYSLDAAHWDSRGWVLQERLLSRRCIYFTTTWLYFQCGHSTTSETGPLSGATTFLGHPRETDHNPPMENPLSLLSQRTLATESSRLLRTFSVYARLVEMYVLRDLTVPSDIVNAFSGIIGVLSTHFSSSSSSSSSFISALPSCALDLALLWTPGQKMLNRTPYPAARTKEYFPSWSWTGWVPWVGRPAYRMLDFSKDKNNSCSLPEPLVARYTLHHCGTMHVIKARGGGGEVGAEQETKQYGVAGPDFGVHVLQFWAETVDALHFTFVTEKKGDGGWLDPWALSDRDHVHTNTAQAVLRLQDKKGRRCGLWWDNKNYRLWYGGERKKEQPRLEFVAVSRSVGKMRGPSRVEGEIKIFDKGLFDEEEGVVNCLVVESFGDVVARVTVAQVHEKAWREARRREKHVRLV